MDIGKIDSLALKIGANLTISKTSILDDFTKVCPTDKSYQLIRKSVLDKYGDMERDFHELMCLIIGPRS